MKLKLIIISCMALWCVAAAQPGARKQKTPKIVYGTASFYSKRFEGAVTASGDTFHHNLPMAASNNFPLDTWVRVTNLKNNKSVIVRIADRMHVNMARDGRVVDLTRTAATKLEYIKRGLARVKVEEVPAGTLM